VQSFLEMADVEKALEISMTMFNDDDDAFERGFEDGEASADGGFG
jgi:hypothetical protein